MFRGQVGFSTAMEPVFGPILAYNLGGLRWRVPGTPFSEGGRSGRFRWATPTPLHPELPNQPGERVAGTMLDERGRVGFPIALEQPLLGH